MISCKNSRRCFVGVILLAVGLIAGVCFSQPEKTALAQGKNANAARYTVVKSEGTNLIVTDNKSNTLYFYAIDPDEKPGAPLILRGSADLNQVGKKQIKPKLFDPIKRN